MKATSICLRDIIERIDSRGTIGLDPTGGWCQDTYLLRVTHEEMINLRVLAKNYPDIEADEKEIDLNS